MTAMPYAEVIGDPVAHSRSPDIHRFWLDELGIAGDYRATLVAKGGVAAYLAARTADPDWRGANVTMPLKLEALLAADKPSDRALAAGAANLLFRKDGQLVAGNSDVGAIIRLVVALADSGRAMRAVTVLGAGGAARAALAALREVKLTNVRLQARDLAAARALAAEFGLSNEPVRFDHPLEGDGLVNATPLGMAGHPALAVDVATLEPQGWVIDMVSNPAPSPLVDAARARGLAAHDGLDMLVEQADASFEIFFGTAPPREKDEALMKRLRS